MGKDTGVNTAAAVVRPPVEVVLPEILLEEEELPDEEELDDDDELDDEPDE